MSYWDKVSKYYNFFIRKDYSVYQEIAKEMAEFLEAGQDILEIGSGPGSLSRFIAPHCAQLTVTDYSQGMLNEAIKNLDSFDNLSFKREDASNLSFPDESFDCIVISNVLHIIPNPELALQEASRVLKGDGKVLIINFLRNKNFKSKAIYKMLNLSGCKTYSKWDYPAFIDFVKRSGFSIAHEKLFTGSLDTLLLGLEKNPEAQA
ncbi:MAG: class I SAM-dependent methyltransferase [Eubacteriales bacterium]|nr:class I SAM-dependent methyltransferase [Eubacteriales bacterium]